MTAFKGIITVVEAMANTCDGRTWSGMKRSVSRMQSGKGKHKHIGQVAITACVNWVKCLTAAMNIQADKVAVREDDDDLKSDVTIDMKVGKGDDFPAECQVAWYTRRMRKSFHHGDHARLVEDADLWAKSEFNPFKCNLGALKVPIAEKLAIFNDVIFGQVLVPMIKAGADEQGKVTSICKQCLEKFSDENVDVVELDPEETSMYNQWLAVWRACIALPDRVGGFRYKDHNATRILFHTSCPAQWNKCNW